MEKYICFTYELSKKSVINPALSLAFIDSVHSLNNSIENLVQNLGENDII